jgi:hypothetical protein
MTYDLPPGAVWVSSSDQLKAALSTYDNRDIVLRDGTYDSAAPFDDMNGNRLFAEHLGAAVLKAGIVLGGNWGPGGGAVRGLAFNVSDPSKTLRNSIIHVWGTGTNTRILDVALEGNKLVGAGIKARQVEGLVIQRVVARDFTEYGVIVDENDVNATVSTPPLLTDLDVANVSQPVPQSSNGTAEACVWVGNTAVVQRVRASHCAWEGLWAGTAATGARFEDISVDHASEAVYFEHFVRSSVLRRLQAGPEVRTGVMCEWADPDWGSVPACVGNVIEHSYFNTRLFGVIMDEGTTSTTVRSSTFVGQCAAAINNYKGINNLSDTSGNRYADILSGARPISTTHWEEATCA